MTLFVILFGILTLVAGLVILINPEIIFGFLLKNLENPALHILAIIIRLVLGVFLIVESSVSRFPMTIEILGWLSIVAAILFGVIGRKYFNSLMKWALSLSNKYGRVGGFIAVIFGSFLIYAFM